MNVLYDGITVVNKYGELLFSTEKPIMYRLGGREAKKNEVKLICKWKYTEPECAWEAECGGMFSFIDGGPRENKYNYCPRCGKLIKSHRAASAA